MRVLQCTTGGEFLFRKTKSIQLTTPSEKIVYCCGICFDPLTQERINFLENFTFGGSNTWICLDCKRNLNNEAKNLKEQQNTENTSCISAEELFSE